MPNLTSYHPPPIHLNRELPKTYCDLIRHEIDYTHFLRTRIANIQSPLSVTNKKHLIKTTNNPRRMYFDHNQRLAGVYQRNLQLCKKILQIWTNNGRQKGGVDCHNENYKEQTNISHFRLRQKHWKDKIENENQRFVHSLIYHRKKYRPTHDRYAAKEAFDQHLKLLQTMSQYPKYILTNPIHKSLLNQTCLPEHIYYNYSQFYNLDSNIPIQAQCQTLPSAYKLKMQKRQIIKTTFNEPNKYARASITYLETILQQTINDAILIYNQPLPSAPNQVKSSYSVDGQSSKFGWRRQQELFQSVSCHELLEPWRHAKQQRGPLGSYTINDNIIKEKTRSFDSYNHIHKQKQNEVNQHLSNSVVTINDQSSLIS